MRSMYIGVFTHTVAGLGGSPGDHPGPSTVKPATAYIYCFVCNVALLVQLEA